MNKKDLTQAVSERTGVATGTVESVLNEAWDQIAGALGGGDKVALAGFGTFEVRERAARTGRNPQTGDTIEIAATKAPAFKPAGALKSRVAQA